MFPSHLIGPVAKAAYDDPLSAVNHERRLVLAVSDAQSVGAPSGRCTPMVTLNRIVHAAHALLTPLATGVLGTRSSSRP